MVAVGAGLAVPVAALSAAPKLPLVENRRGRPQAPRALAIVLHRIAQLLAPGHVIDHRLRVIDNVMA